MAEKLFFFKMENLIMKIFAAFDGNYDITF